MDPAKIDLFPGPSSSPEPGTSQSFDDNIISWAGYEKFLQHAAGSHLHINGSPVKLKPRSNYAEARRAEAERRGNLVKRLQKNQRHGRISYGIPQFKEARPTNQAAFMRRRRKMPELKRQLSAEVYNAVFEEDTANQTNTSTGTLVVDVDGTNTDTDDDSERTETSSDEDDDSSDADAEEDDCDDASHSNKCRQAVNPAKAGKFLRERDRILYEMKWTSSEIAKCDTALQYWRSKAVKDPANAPQFEEPDPGESEVAARSRALIRCPKRKLVRHIFPRHLNGLAPIGPQAYSRQNDRIHSILTKKSSVPMELLAGSHLCDLSQMPNENWLKRIGTAAATALDVDAQDNEDHEERMLEHPEEGVKKPDDKSTNNTRTLKKKKNKQKGRERKRGEDSKSGKLKSRAGIGPDEALLDGDAAWAAMGMPKVPQVDYQEITVPQFREVDVFANAPAKDSDAAREYVSPLLEIAKAHHEMEHRERLRCEKNRRARDEHKSGATGSGSSASAVQPACVAGIPPFDEDAFRARHAICDDLTIPHYDRPSRVKPYPPRAYDVQGDMVAATPAPPPPDAEREESSRPPTRAGSRRKSSAGSAAGSRRQSSAGSAAARPGSSKSASRHPSLSPANSSRQTPKPSRSSTSSVRASPSPSQLHPSRPPTAASTRSPSVASSSATTSFTAWCNPSVNPFGYLKPVADENNRVAVPKASGTPQKFICLDDDPQSLSEDSEDSSDDEDQLPLKVSQTLQTAKTHTAPKFSTAPARVLLESDSSESDELS